MKLILMRHAHDLQGIDEGQSSVSKQGRDHTRKTACKVLDYGIQKIDLAVHSPALRCEQTLHETANLIDITAVTQSEYAGEDGGTEDMDALLRQLDSLSPDYVLIVGHEPKLSNSVRDWLGLCNGCESDESPPWTLSRGDAVLLTVEVRDEAIQVNPTSVFFFGMNPPAAITPATN